MRQRKFKWSSISSSGWVHEVMEYSSAIPPQRAAPLNGHSSSSVPTAGNVWRIKIVPWFWSEHHLYMIGKFGLRRDILHTFLVIWNLVNYISLAIYLVCQRCKPKQTKPIKKKRATVKERCCSPPERKVIKFLDRKLFLWKLRMTKMVNFEKNLYWIYNNRKNVGSATACHIIPDSFQW